MIPKLFTRYGQTEQAGGRRGTGLGLFVVKGIVEAHGGKISAQNTPGGGATFTFTLPRVQPEPDRLGAPAADPPGLPSRD